MVQIIKLTMVGLNRQSIKPLTSLFITLQKTIKDNTFRSNKIYFLYFLDFRQEYGRNTLEDRQKLTKKTIYIFILYYIGDFTKTISAKFSRLRQ